MDPQIRFEFIEQIAQGDFATIFRARDRELGREVAIKQIHAQFLADPRHLDRYWQEAQILASLEHPHIVRIYDLVRDRGWLVLELMRGSLKQMLDGRPIDLNDLRMTLTYSCHALQFMHANGILHGDVKPSNLLVDRNQRVKLGDFGIARRIYGDHGSVVKGTTRYMAPEVVSDQFGPVGPHSDLYSLGFSAYELLCGSNFESLFPGLNMYGRDQQIAWMMWHSQLDRRLPEIQRVLEGVPADLAYIIQRMVEKDATRRYRTAEEVLADLKANATAPIGPSREELEAQAEQERRAATRKRWLAIGAFAFSITATLAMLFIPAPELDRPQATKAEERPTAGRVGEIDLSRSMVFVQPDGDSRPQGIEVLPDRDRIFINDQRATLADLRHNERVAIQYLSNGGTEFVELSVKRAAESELAGSIAELDMTAAVIVLAPPAGANSPPPQLYVPDGTPISINGQSRNANRPFQLSDLAVGDSLDVRYAPSDEGRLVAKTVEALRSIEWHGWVVNRAPNKQSLDIRLTAASAEPGSPAAGAVKSLTVAADCRITINGQDHLANQATTLADLQAGDVVKIQADSVVHAITAIRELKLAGAIATIDAPNRKLTIQPASGGELREVKLAPQATLRLTGDGPAIDLAFLRAGDQVDVQLTLAPDASGERNADAVQVTPQSDPRAWAILIGQTEFDDARLPKSEQAKVDLAAVRRALTMQYRIPEAQILQLDSASRLRLQQEVEAFVAKAPAESQLICYASGIAWIDATAGPVWATKEFDSTRPGETGLPLRWLVERLGQAASRERFLLLDAQPPPATSTTLAIPSTFEVVEALRPKPMRPVSANVLIVGSCEKGQWNRVPESGKPSLFATATASAFAGAADANKDQRVAGVELIENVVREVERIAGDDSPQRPVVWIPEHRPPRLTPPARAAALRMLGLVRATRLEGTYAEEYQTDNKLAANQPDIALAYALALLKHNRTPLSRPIFERVRADHPRNAVAHQALAWQNYLQNKYVEGLSDLKLLVDALPDPEANPDQAPFVRQALELAGALREFALRAAEPPVDAAASKSLDQAVLARGEWAKTSFQKGIDQFREGLKLIDQELADEMSPDKLRTLQLDRKRLTYYASFNFQAVADYLKQQAED